jgi:hypothetical protein
VTALEYFLLILYWYVIPCVVLPITAARICGASFLRGLKILRHWEYWLSMAAIALVGVLGTKLLIGWMPGTTLTQQTIGMASRLVLAYLIATAAWLLTAGVLGYFLAGDEIVANLPFAPVLNKIAPEGGETRSILRHSVTVIRDRRLIYLQLATGFVAALLYIWNPGTSAEVTSLVAGILLEFVLLVVFLWIYSSTLAYGTDPVAAEFRNAFRLHWLRILWAFVGFILLVALQEVSSFLLMKLNDYDTHYRLISHISDLTSDYLIPCLIFPWATVKILGRPFRDGLQILRSWRYWVGMALIIYCANWVSSQLIFGRSETTILWKEILEIPLRTLSYLPIVIGWVAAAGLVSYFFSARASNNIVRQPAS